MGTVMENTQILVQTFTAAAEKVSAVVSRVSTMAQAYDYAVELCERREACQLLIAGCQESLSAPADTLCRPLPDKLPFKEF